MTTTNLTTATTLVVLATTALGYCLYAYSPTTPHRFPIGRNRWVPLEYSVLVGVVGGLGPKATVYFMQDVVDARTRLFRAMSGARTGQERLVLVKGESTSEWTFEQVEVVWRQTEGREQLSDQDHIPLVVAQATTVPPRPKFILGESKVDPVPQMISVAEGLENAGATHLAIVCNTAHWFWPQVASAVSIPVLDMVKLALNRVVRMTRVGKKVGLFATRATLGTQMYQTAGKLVNLTFVSPLDVEGGQGQDRLEQVIFGKHGIKSGFDSPDRNEESRQSVKILLEEALRLNAMFGVQVVVLGCTELPLIVNRDTITRWTESLFPDPATRYRILNDIEFVDPGRVLCDEILRMTLLSRS